MGWTIFTTIDLWMGVFLLDMLRVPEQSPVQPLSNNLLDVSQWIALAVVVFGACLLTFVPRTEAR